MKKVLAILFSGALMFGGLAGCTSTANAPKPATSEPAPPAGAYTADRAITPDDLAVFETAMKGVADTKTYEPTQVATQVVAGTNYRFTVKITDGDAKREAHVFILKPLEGDPTFVSEENL